MKNGNEEYGSDGNRPRFPKADLLNLAVDMKN